MTDNSARRPDISRSRSATVTAATPRAIQNAHARTPSQPLPDELLASQPHNVSILTMYTHAPTAFDGAQVVVSHAHIPWAKEGDVVEVRPVQGDVRKGKKAPARGGFLFRVGADGRVELRKGNHQTQISVSRTVSDIFGFSNRHDVELIKVEESAVEADFVELMFSGQYLGRADMWRLGMSLEDQAIHVGQKVAFAGTIRAEVKSIFIEGHRYSSAIMTAKTKTIFRSKSAQAYIFIQLCQEMYEFDEDGERYYEKAVHGFLPELFHRWTESQSTHVVTIILFSRIYYNDEDVQFLRMRSLTDSLRHDQNGRWHKDFFKVVFDFESRRDWTEALPEIKLQLMRSEEEMLQSVNVSENKDGEEQRILGQWSFAYEGNILEAINVALNPFDEHYIDRDLSRTGLSMTVVTPGTGHFAVDRNFLRLTSERMDDHGINIDLVCLTKMPLHVVPIFSFKYEKTVAPVEREKAKETPDPLYCDTIHKAGADITNYYLVAAWVYCSFYSKTHDKPFRNDRFVSRCKMYEIQMLGILDHNLTTVVIPTLDPDAVAMSGRFNTNPLPLAPSSGLMGQSEERRMLRDTFDADIFGGAHREIQARDFKPLPRTGSARNSLLSTSYQSERKIHPESILSSSLRQDGPKRFKGGISFAEEAPIARLPPRSPSPTLSLLAATVQRRPLSPSVASVTSSVAMDNVLASGASTPRLTPAKKALRSQASKSSFAGKFGSGWLFGALGGRSQPSFPTAEAMNVERRDVSSDTKKTPKTPVTEPSPLPTAVPGAPSIVTNPPQEVRPMPITIKPRSVESKRRHQEDAIDSSRTSLKEVSDSSRHGKSWDDLSWKKKAGAALTRADKHTVVNPCHPSGSTIDTSGHGRRWQHSRPKAEGNNTHLVKWKSLTAPACLPLTTHFIPSAEDLKEHFTENAYDIACFPGDISFLLKSEGAHENLPLAVMREMASQRLSQNFQFVVLHQDAPTESKSHRTNKVLMQGESTTAGLRTGGASEVLKDASGPIYLSWWNQIHRLAFDPQKQSVTVQRFVRKVRFSQEAVKYECLVWPAKMSAYQPARATFEYPRIEKKINFNYLDRLIAGEEAELTDSLRYWRTRFMLIPSDKLPNPMSDPSGQPYRVQDILINGAAKLLELMGRNQWQREDHKTRAPRLLPTTFDPSACVLDDGLMAELERITSGRDERQMASGRKLAGMALTAVASAMAEPDNGLSIRDRWWQLTVHEDAFTGDAFCTWLSATFADVPSREKAVEWGTVFLEKGLIEHSSQTFTFIDGHFFYQLKGDYARHIPRKGKKGWFGRATRVAREPIEVTALPSTATLAPPGKPRPRASSAASFHLLQQPSVPKKRKITMSQRLVIDLDPQKKSDRAEVAILHCDIIHNPCNAFHFELNWLGVTAGLIDDLRARWTPIADRHGLRLVEAPVEQVKDLSKKCAYRAPIPIPLALAPPVVEDLHLRLVGVGAGHVAQFFEYAILTQRFGFVLDVEASNRYPDDIEVEYSYRRAARFDHSQFIHRSGVALVQCIGGMKGFLWSDNRLFFSAPLKSRGVSGTGHDPLAGAQTRQQQADTLRRELTAFCADPVALAAFFDDVLPPLPELHDSKGVVQPEEDEKEEKQEEVVQ